MTRFVPMDGYLINPDHVRSIFPPDANCSKTRVYDTNAEMWFYSDMKPETLAELLSGETVADLEPPRAERELLDWTVPNVISVIRERLGMSQATLADAIGMSREALGKMERQQAIIERRTRLALEYVYYHGGKP